MHLALSILLYGNEIWTLRKKDKGRLTSIEMNFSEEQPGTPFFGHKRNEEILEKLEVEPVDDKFIGHKSKRLHVTRMNNRMPKNNAEWTNTTGKTFGETIKRG
jgi:hypothetical protein